MGIITRVNWVDVLVLILMFRMSYIAFQEGLSREILPFIGSITIIIFSLHYYNKISNFLYQNLFKLPLEALNFLSFLILIIGIGFIFKLLKIFLDNIIKVEWHPFLEKFGGLLVGLARAAVASSIILITIALMPLPYLQWSVRERSLAGMHFLKIGPAIYEKASKFLPMMKKGEVAISKEEIVKELVTDKSILPKAKKEKAKSPSWEDEE